MESDGMSSNNCHNHKISDYILLHQVGVYTTMLNTSLTVYISVFGLPKLPLSKPVVQSVKQ